MLTKSILCGVEITTNSKEEILNSIENYLSQTAVKPLTIVTPNPEQVVLVQKDAHFRQLLNAADIALPDGVGIVWGWKLVHRSWFMVHGKNENKPRTMNYEPRTLIRTIPGIDFMEQLIQLAAEKGYPVALIGGRNGVAQEALDTLQKKYSGLIGWAEDGPEVGVHSSWFMVHGKEYFEPLVAKIIDTNVSLVFVGLGAPKQEYFMEMLSSWKSKEETTNPLILMSVGGAFDEISGRIARSPDWINKLGCKWLWRLVHEPWRWQRQRALLTFITLIIQKQKYR